MSKSNAPQTRLQKTRPISMQHSSSSSMVREELRPLPIGWVMQIDPRSNRPFYVDTNISPPLSTWEHPFESFRYPREDSPSSRGNKLKQRQRSEDDRQGRASQQEVERQRSEFDHQDYRQTQRRPERSEVGRISGSRVGTRASERPQNQMKRRVSFAQDPKDLKEPNEPGKGFFGRLKEAALGSKEEREAKEELSRAQRRHKEEMMRDMNQRRRVEVDREDAMAALYPGWPRHNTYDRSQSEDGMGMPLAVAGAMVVGVMPENSYRRSVAGGGSTRQLRPRTISG